MGLFLRVCPGPTDKHDGCAARTPNTPTASVCRYMRQLRQDITGFGTAHRHGYGKRRRDVCHFKHLSKFFHNDHMHPTPPPTTPALTPDFETSHFKQALSRFATGVTVITTFAHGASKGQVHSSQFAGITASSFNSVSLTPPLVLWSLGHRASSLPLFHAGTHYVVNVLAADQLDLCQRFASGQGDRFANTDYSLGQAGLPILKGALAWFECHNRSRYEEGDHVIFVGEVERCGFSNSAAPLVFQGGQFSTTKHLP
jgi:flavin reductase (DIM6/NTAB) family NADH-FMN oxidoreductase RutF